MIMLKLIEARWPALLLQDLRQLQIQPEGFLRIYHFVSAYVS